MSEESVAAIKQAKAAMAEIQAGIGTIPLELPEQNALLKLKFRVLDFLHQWTLCIFGAHGDSTGALFAPEAFCFACQKPFVKSVKAQIEDLQERIELLESEVNDMRKP